MEERVKLKKRLKVAISQNLGVDFTEGVKLGTTYSENVARRIYIKICNDVGYTTAEIQKELGIHIKNVQRNIRMYKNDYIYNKGFRSLADKIKLDVYRQILIMETKKFTNLQDFMRFLNYSKEDIWVKNNKAYNASKNEVAELIINNKDN